MSSFSERLIYSYKSAAYLLDMSPQALRDLVYKSRGPITTKVGRRTYFTADDLMVWVTERRSLPNFRMLDEQLPARSAGRPTVKSRQSKRSSWCLDEEGKPY